MNKKLPEETEKISAKDYDVLINAVKNYEQRIKEIEGSIYWRTYQFFTKTKLILTSDSYLKSDKWRFFQRIRFLISRPGIMLMRKFISQFFALTLGKVKNIFIKKTVAISPYQRFKEAHFPREADLIAMKENIKNFSVRPSIEILAFVNENNFKNLNPFLMAIEAQVYDKLRVSFILEDQINEKINYTLNKVIGGDEVYNIYNYSEFIKNASKAKAEYCYFTDINAIPTPDAIYQMVAKLNTHKKCEIIYSDNDYFDQDGLGITFNPYFKPDFSPQTLWSRNYIGKNFIVHTSLIGKINFCSKPNFYDLILKLTHQAKDICHVAKILFHQYAEKVNADEIKANHLAINNHLSTISSGAFANLSSESAGCFEPVFPLPIQEPLISIIIPCKNKGQVLDTCLNSIFEKSIYKNFEVIIIDNGSNEKSFFSTVALWEYNYPNRVRCYHLDIPFNYSTLNNRAVKFANGEYILFLNNDTELISPDLLPNLLQYAQLDQIGMVGPKLLYPNNTIQHAGIILSIDDTGAHIYSGAYKDTAGYFNNTNCLTNYSAVTGACMMISKEKFENIEGFDESLAVDCNDVELCCKLLDVGLYNLYVPFVKMIHYECLTRGNPMLSKRSIVRQQIEKDYFIDKWNKYVKNDPFYNVNLSKTSKIFEY